MSPNTSAARARRVPRFAEAAVERARLTVVPQRLGRSQAARTPFTVLVLGLLVAGVVGLLMFNTHMQQSSFTATALQQQVTSLTAQEQSLGMELEHLRDPQTLARTARQQLHMVAPSTPAFVRLSDGRVLGKPTPATSADAVRITPLPAQVPADIARRTVIVQAKPAKPATPAKPAQSSQSSAGATKSGTDTRGTSPTGTSANGRKGGGTTTSPAHPGAPR